MKISKYCNDVGCYSCPFYDEDNCYCIFTNLVPLNWNVNDIMERFKKLKG